jgi:hypothetical protein
MGQALTHLTIVRVVHPKAPISHARAFLFNMDSAVALHFSQAVVCAEQFLRCWIKRFLATCERAYWTFNMHKVRLLQHGDAETLV